MTRIKRSPFGSQPVKLFPVADRDDGRRVWFARLPITPDTNPVDLQELQRKQARITALLFIAANKVSADRKIPPDDARSLFFPQKDADGTETIPLNFMDYLDDRQMEEFLILQNEAADLPIKCATVFLRKRLAFDLSVDRLVDSNRYEVLAPWFDVSPKDRFKFGDEVFTVKSAQEGLVEFDRQLGCHRTGFLMQEDGEYQLGDKDWTEIDTRSILSVQQISAIYRFYEICASGEGSGEGEEGKPQNSPTSTDTPIPPQSTGGETSTLSAAPLESPVKTIASPGETLAIAQLI